MRQINTKIRIAVFFFGIFASVLLAFPVEASDITEKNVLYLINRSRSDAGLPELGVSDRLMRVADLKVQDMLDNKYFAHTSPTGVTPWHWFSKVNYDYEYAGENLAIDFTSAESQDDAWMKSETHRRNILSPKYTETGIAIAVGDVGDHTSIITVQVFASPRGILSGANPEFTSAPDKKIDLGENRDGAILLTKGMDETPEGGQGIWNKFGRKIMDNSESLGSFLWMTILILASFVLVINPIRLISKSYENIYAILEDRIKKYLTFQRCRKKYEELLFKIKLSREERKTLDGIKSIKLRV